jgi:uroporphyrinogen decarboxylase
MAQTDREALNAILHYKDFDHVPVMHFGFWVETLEKWVTEGHLTRDEVDDLIIKGNMADGNEYESAIAHKLGFDDNALVYTGQRGNWYDMPLYPAFEEKVVERHDDGSFIKVDLDGVFVKGKEGAQAIPAEVDHTLKDRESFEKEYMPRLRWTPDRLNMDEINAFIADNDTRTRHTCVYAGSLFGKPRNYLGLVDMSYMQKFDPDLFRDIIDAVGDVCYEVVKHTLATGVKVDFCHFWEDICYNKGSLVNPAWIRDLAGKHYRRIADECEKYGVDIVSLDCDGFVEELVPVWLDNGVNTMFPIEYGAWEYDFSTMRKKFGKELRGIGNMKKHVLAESREAIDAEVERLRRLVDLGGYVPCPDHRIAPDAEWDLVKYYCEQMHKAFD